MGAIVAQENGLTYSSNDSFIECLNRLLEDDDLRHSMSLNSKRLYSERFEGQRQYNSYVDFVGEYCHES